MYDGLKNLEIPTKRKHPGARRVAKISGVLMLCLAVLFGASAVAVYRKIQGKLDKTHDHSLRLPPAPLDGPQNILVLGSDDRTGLTKAEMKELHISRAGGRRSDTIILLHINPKKDKAVLVHFPRDLLVRVPSRSGLNRINTSYADGGAKEVIKTVQDLTGMQINHYVEVSFVAFKGLVDAVGGVSLYIPKKLYDEKSGLNIQQTGCVQLTGTQALAFVRARHIYPNQDLGRIQAQQRFMRALLGKVKSAGTILNPFKVSSIADAIGDGLKTDPKVNISLARSIAGALSDFGTSGLDFRVIPSYTRSGSPYVYVNQSQARAFFSALAADRTLPPYGKTKQSKADPQDVTVQIFNGTSTSGLAGREASRLRKFKFDARIGGNARHVPKTIIKYAPEAQQKALLVAKKYPNADIVLAQNQDVDVAVILGPDSIVPSAKPTTAAKPKTPQIGEACG